MEKKVLSQEDRTKLQKIQVDAMIEIDRICKKHNITYTLGYGTLIGAVRHKGFIPWDDDLDICMMRNDYERFKEVCKTELNEKYFYQSNDTDREYFHLFNKIRVNGTVFRETFLDSYNIHHGVYIDIFPVDNLADGKLKRFFQYYVFYFFRTGLMAKYMNINARSGKKKLLMQAFRLLFFCVPVDKLYKMSIKIARKYNKCKTNNVHRFGSASKSKDIFDTDMYLNTIDIEFEGHKFLAPKRYDEMLTSIYGDYMKLPPVEKRTTRHDLTEYYFE